jgi:integrase
MASRRSRGDGGLHWDATRERWVATLTVGYTPAGKRIVKKGSGRTKTEAKAVLKEIIRDHDDGVTISSAGYTVRQAVEDWLTGGLAGRAASTVENRRILATMHVINPLGARKLRDLTADDVDTWLADRAKVVSTSTLQRVKAILRLSIARAQAREKVKRNVVLLCETPTGLDGRPSKALTMKEAIRVLTAAEQSPLKAYLVVSLLTGARTEELRPLDWSHVDLDGVEHAHPPVVPHIMVWRSVREGGDTKTRRSRRSLALPARCVQVLREHQDAQVDRRKQTGRRWQETGLVFTTQLGTEMDAANVRRTFRRVVKAAGLDPKAWTPRELRHSFVSLLSDGGMDIEQISKLVGHKGTQVTELVYRKQLRPVVQEGATAMDRLFPVSNQ